MLRVLLHVFLGCFKGSLEVCLGLFEGLSFVPFLDYESFCIVLLYVGKKVTENSNIQVSFVQLLSVVKEFMYTYFFPMIFQTCCYFEMITMISKSRHEYV